MKKLIPVIAGCFLFFSCVNETVHTETAIEDDDTADMHVHNNPAFSNLDYASDRDPVCMMPLSAGISDTAMIDSKLYGFCSPQCKDTYVKENRK